jgi:hypothetical protein
MRWIRPTSDDGFLWQHAEAHNQLLDLRNFLTDELVDFCQGRMEISFIKILQ